jgi:hypothetical protein
MLVRAAAGKTGLFLLLSVWFVIAGGCGGNADFGESVTLPQEQRTSVQGNFAEGKPLCFPKDRPFNVCDSQRSSSGAGEAESAAAEAGTARCKAEANGVGVAKAEFQIGQVVYIPTEEPIEATIVFDVNCAYTTRTDPNDTTKPEDKLGLKVYIRGSNGHVLKRQMLADLETSKGAETFSGRLAPSFDVTLEPGLAYHVVLAGLVEVSGTEKSTASAEIDIRSLEIELLPRKSTQQPG